MRMVWMVPAALLMVTSVAAAQSGPEGWEVRHEGTEIAMQPPDLEPGQIYVLSVRANVDLGSQAPRAWLASRVDNQAKLGKKVKGSGIQERPNGALAASRTYVRSDGSTLDAVFSLARQPNGKVLLLTIVCSPAACDAHGPAALAWLRSPAGKRIGQEALVGPKSAPKSEPKTEPRSRPTRLKRRHEYQTDPGRGLAPAAIEGVVGERRESGRISPILLLKNGEYCSELDVPPEDMDVALHKKRNRRQWGRWRRQRGKYQVQEGRKWVAAPTWGSMLAPGRAGEELSGTFASGGGNYASSFVKEIAFFPGGRFATRKSGSGGGIGGFRIERGSYRFDGHTIEFLGDDGTMEREAFHWVSAKKDAAFFNNRFFSREE
jgi:hypothetical protein